MVDLAQQSTVPHSLAKPIASIYFHSSLFTLHRSLPLAPYTILTTTNPQKGFNHFYKFSWCFSLMLQTWVAQYYFKEY